MIGSGSSSEVWLAHGVTGVWRSVKVIRRDRLENTDPFEREFHAVRRYEQISRGHAHLVDVLHVGRDDVGAYFYYVMELADDVYTGREVDPEHYVPHTVLDNLTDGGPHSANTCLDMAEAICDALVHLHGNGLVHRDIKPGNILYIDKLPRLADIGLVAPTGRTSFVGTNGYIPPEGPGSETGDVYALGKVLYELLTGQDRLAFPDLPAVGGGHHWTQEQRSLNRVILRACDNNAARRYPNANAMMADLKRIRDGRKLRTPLRVPPSLTIAGVVLLTASLAWFLRGVTGMKRPQEARPTAAGQPAPEMPPGALPAIFRALAADGLKRNAANCLDRLLILQGECGQKALNPAHPWLSVRPGWPVAGSVRILARNAHGPGATFPVGWMPSWERGSHAVRVVTIDQQRFEQECVVDIQARAPERPGRYYLLFAGAGQLNVHNIMSATSRPPPRSHQISFAVTART